MVAVAPFSVLLMFVAYFVLLRAFDVDVADVGRARALLREKSSELGALSRREKGVAAVAALTIVAWVAARSSAGMATVSLTAAVALFAFGLIDWRSVEEYVNWGVILMYGGAIAVASSLHETGAARFMADAALSRVGDLPAYWVMVAFAAVAALLTEAISNVAAVALLLPVCFGIAEGSGLPPVATVFAVAVPAGLAFALPMGTPPNAIAYSAGYYRLRDSVIAGSLLKVVALVLLAFVIRVYWPLLGIGG